MIVFVWNYTSGWSNTVWQNYFWTYICATILPKLRHESNRLARENCFGWGVQVISHHMWKIYCSLITMVWNVKGGKWMNTALLKKHWWTHQHQKVGLGTWIGCVDLHSVPSSRLRGAKCQTRYDLNMISIPGVYIILLNITCVSLQPVYGNLLVVRRLSFLSFSWGLCGRGTLSKRQVSSSQNLALACLWLPATC